MKKIIFNNGVKFLFLATLFAFTSCSGTKIVSDLDDVYNFNNVETYAITYDFNEASGESPVNTINQKRIEQSIKAEMDTRGLQFDGENPDVIINYYTNIEQEQRIHTSGSAYGSGYGRWGFRGMNASGSKTATIETSSNGFITIEMYDSKRDEIVWYAQGEKSIDEKTVSTKAKKEISTIIDKMMNSFPVKEQTIAKK